jgi:D-alanyl-D-alanine carboxypeptidase/D-alanyl-D-alanine-endopeptidase (penicillin-binding protein 4)
LLLAGAFLGRDRHTVEEAAFMVGYSTANSLARAMKRETGKTPGDVARSGGLGFVHEALFPLTVQPKKRRSTVRSLFLAGLLATQTACAGLGLGGPSADGSAVDRALGAPPMDQVHFGVLAVDAQDGRVLYARNIDRKFIPASNQKILATATALSLLGPDYTYETTVWRAGLEQNGTLDGDLVLVGNGDPTLSERYWASGEAALAALADSLHAGGLRRVSGALVVDASAWDSTAVPGSWSVGDLPYRYGSSGGAFALEQGELHVVVTGGATEATPAESEWHPKGTDGYVSSHIVTAGADSSTSVQALYRSESRHIELTGRIALGTTDTLSFALRDPVREATAALARALHTAGIAVDGGWSVSWKAGELLGGGCRSGAIAECARGERLAALTSPPLSEIIQGILEPSQNWMTEQLVRTLGAELGEEGSWSEGVDVVEGFLTGAVHVAPLDLRLRDGSGMSHQNLVTPRALVAILRHMAAGPHASVYRHALAEPGEEGSTLSRRLSGLEGRVYAKTGTITNVNSLSGYLVRNDGREVVFSILSNGSGLPASQVREAIDDVVRVLAR